METTQLWQNLESAVVELLEAGEDAGEIEDAVGDHIESYNTPYQPGAPKSKK
jgi:hypothetical protein